LKFEVEVEVKVDIDKVVNGIDQLVNGIILTRKQKAVKTSIKVVKKLCSINVHFVMHGQSDSEESFSSVTSSAHGNHDKSNNL
jgi:hypothetical protein